MSNQTRAERHVNSLDAVPLDEIGHVVATGLQAVTFALLDVADAIREQTARIEVLVTEAK